MARALIPRRCIVHAIELRGDGRAEVRYRCEVDGQMETGQHKYPTPDGYGYSNYPSKMVKARSVRFRGMTVTGQARVDFVLSPASATCKKSGREISCKLIGDKSLPSLQGLRRPRRSR